MAGVFSHATQTNQKLFRRYAKVFVESDAPTFTSYAEKLAAWLSDYKAYYSAARPEIVNLLLIAQFTLRKALGIQEILTVPFNISDYPDHPMVAPYAKLVKSVEPFANLFVEPALSAYIKSLIDTLSPVHPSSSEDNAHPLLSASKSQPAPHHNTSNLNNQHTSESEVQILENPNPQTPLSASNYIQVEQLASSTASRDLAPGSSAIQRPGKVKAKKRKTIDFDLLVQHDIQGLLQRQGSQTVSYPSKSITTDIPKTQSEYMCHDVAPKLETPVSENVSFAIDSIASSGSSMPKEEVLKFPDFSKQGSSPKKATPTETSVTSIDNSNTVAKNGEVQSASPPKVINTPINTDQPMGRGDISVDLHQAVQTENIISQSSVIEDTAMDIATSQARRDKDVEDQTVTTQVNGPIPMDVDDDKSETAIKPALPSGPEMDVDRSQPLTSDNGAPVQIVRSQVSVAPENPSINDLPITQHDQMLGIFGPEMRIVAFQPGLEENSRISVQFDISETQFNLVSQWINRHKSSQDIRSSICLTLGCYSTSGLREQWKKDGFNTFEKQVSSTKSVWPHSGGLIMNVNLNNVREDFPLSPPFLVTPDNLVDVSQFLVPGKNVIELNQRQDLSQYTFVLHAHYPTLGQLKQVEDRREKDKRWHEWLRATSGPFDIPLRPFVKT